MNPEPTPIEIAKACRLSIESLRKVRDDAVVVALASGHGSSEVAAETGISRSFIRQIVRQHDAQKAQK